jgi:hypothetical protein
VLPFGAVVITEEGEATCIQAFEQQHPTMRASVVVDRRQGHGIRLDRQLLGLYRLGEPLLEQAEWFTRCLRLAQTITGVVAAHIGQGWGHGKALKNRICLAYPPRPHLA